MPRQWIVTAELNTTKEEKTFGVTGKLYADEAEALADFNAKHGKTVRGVRAEALDPDPVPPVEIQADEPAPEPVNFTYVAPDVDDAPDTQAPAKE
jgi:hypothetical protein